jgi:protein O-GlcNAc transferase
MPSPDLGISYADIHALITSGRIREAEQLLDVVQGELGKTLEVLVLRGMAVAQSNPGLALEHLRQAARTHPMSALAQFEMGKLALEANQFEEALEAARRGLSATPEDINCQVLMALIYQRTGKVLKSRASADRVLSLDANHITALQILAEANTNLGAHDDATAVYLRLLELAPRRTDIRSSYLLHTLYNGSCRANVDLLHTEQGRYWSADRMSVSPRTVTGSGKLTVGYVSPNWYHHSVAYFLSSLLTDHDRNQFRVVGYSNSSEHDDMTDRLRGLCDVWRDVNNTSPAQIATQVQQDGVHILVDLAGHTGRNLLTVFALKPAPIQVSYLGYAASTGLEAMDGRIGDYFTDPDNVGLDTSVIRLERCFLAYTPPALPPLAGASNAAPDAPIMFGSFNNTAKYSSLTLDLWVRVLRAVPNSTLVLKHLNFRDPDMCDAIRQRFETRGVDPQRIVTKPYSATLVEHLETYGAIDIALDCTPYNGTTTTVEAALMGVPTVSLVGESHASRVGLSILEALGLPELAARDDSDFVAAAASLAKDDAKRGELRLTLRTRLLTSSLGDGAGLARAVERKFLELWRARE